MLTNEINLLGSNQGGKDLMGINIMVEQISETIRDMRQNKVR
jgi:hypothetical protein